MKPDPYPNHCKTVKRDCNRFRKQADRHRPADRYHLYELIAEVEWLSTEYGFDAKGNEDTKMKVCLDLCCGKGGATQAFRDKPDWHVVGVDVDKRFCQQWQGKNVSFVLADVTTIDWSSFLEDVGIPKVDFLWASPPCTHFSLANPKWPRFGIRKAMEIAGSCFEAVAVLKPKHWLIENPRGRLRHLARKPHQTIFYSDYDDSMTVQKPTDLWGNVNLPMVPHVRRPSKPHGKNDRSCSWDYFRCGIDAAFVPLGVSEAVYTSVQQRLEAQS